MMKSIPRSDSARVHFWIKTEMNLPVISVVIPTYNHASLLKNAIDSVLNQSFQEWEAIIVNNYSEDNTVEIIASYKDKRIRLVNFRNNGIIAASRNQGIKLSTGKFIAFLDSDDIWYPEKLDRCLRILESGCDAVCHGEMWVEDGVKLRKVFYGPKQRTTYLSLLYTGNCLSTSAIIVRKELLELVGGFDEDPLMVTVEDYDLWLRLAKSGCDFAFLDEILGEYRLHGNNLSKVVMKHFNAELALLHKHFSKIPDSGLASRLYKRKRLSQAYCAASRRMQEENSQYSSAKLLYQSWIKFPFLLKQYGILMIGILKLLRFGRYKSH